MSAALPIAKRSPVLDPAHLAALDGTKTAAQEKGFRRVAGARMDSGATITFIAIIHFTNAFVRVDTRTTSAGAIGPMLVVVVELAVSSAINSNVREGRIAMTPV